jgi:hypothetical protein
MTPPDEGQGGMDAGLPGPAELSARVAALVERGLERYGKGDLAGALGEWEHALALDPNAAQAKEYIEYVRENFATLDEQFRAASAMKEAADAAGVPIPEEPEDVSGAYDLVQLEQPAEAPAEGDAPDEIDEGWELDDLAAPLPPPPAKAAAAQPSSLDEDLAEVAAGLQLKDTGASDNDDYGEYEASADTSPVLEMEADEPEGTYTPTTPGLGEDEAPPLAGTPKLSADAIAALGGRVPPVTIRPRSPESTSAGTVPGKPLPQREEGPTPVPGELPAPPHVATPPSLEIELASLESGGADDHPDTLELEPEYHSGVESIPNLSLGVVPDSDSGGINETIELEASAPNDLLPAGVGEPVGSALLGLGDDTGEATRPSGAKRALELLPEDMPTFRQTGGLSGPPAAGLADDALELGGDDFDDQPRTAERKVLDPAARSPFGGDITAGSTESLDRPAEGTAPGAPAVIVDEQLLRALDDSDSGDEPTNARARVPVNVHQLGVASRANPRASSEAPTNARQSLPGNDADEERVRRRVTELLALAREAAERGDHLSAVEAAEAAAAEDPDGKIGPVILHRHRDLLYRIYEGHIGEMTQVPLLAVPLHQIAAEPLDHRTGFLLSRIDGLLSFEDILDVAGMPRLDAYRILSNLLRRGFIEVR